MRDRPYRTAKATVFGVPVLLVTLAALCSGTRLAAEPWPPLPPPRPAAAPVEPTPSLAPTTAPPPAPAAAPETAKAAEEAPQSDDCVARLKRAGYDVETTAAPAAANQECKIENPVKLRTIPVPGREKSLKIPAEPVIACRFAESLGTWLGTLGAPMILGASGSELAAVQTGPGFQCRNRNRLPSGKLSAHAAGLAIDIASFELADGSRIAVKPNGQDKHISIVNAVRQAACGWFTTVLGPGSDAAHADHLHVDLQLHGSSDRYRICQ